MSHLTRKEQVTILRALVEGCSIRSTSRMTAHHVKTILDLLVRVGEGCVALHDEYVQDLSCNDIQLDEIWCYVGCKQKKLSDSEKLTGAKGDQYTFTALDRDSKLMISYLVGKRSWSNAASFCKDVKDRLSEGVKPQLSSDCFSPYPDAVERAFGADVHYGQLDKDFGATDPGRGRYSPPKVVKTGKRIVMGEPDEDRICTSHVERQNLTMRMGMRRFTRLTNAFSKKLRNLKAAVALHFAYYNFCRPHTTLKGITPAMAAGLTDHIWSLSELIDEACPPWVEKVAA